MALDLASRLVDEGLVSPVDLAVALAETGSPSCLIARLVGMGADSERMVQLFEGEYGLPVGPVALAGAPTALTMRMPASLAYGFHALPVVETTEFIVVALSDPSNSHAIAEISRALGSDIRPRPARVGDLRQALLRAYPDGDSTPPEPSAPRSEGTKALGESPTPSAAPLELTRAKPKTAKAAPPVASDTSADTDHAASTANPDQAATSGADQGAGTTDPDQGHDEAAALPLSRPKLSRSKRPAADEDRPSRTFQKPVEQADNSSWTTLDRRSPEPSTGGAELGPILAEIRDAGDRDAVVAAACQGALNFARTVVFLTLRRGVMRGWEARGGGVSADAVRNLWIPASSPSMFRRVVEGRETYRGPYGSSAADHLYRAAIGSRGGTIEILPITVRGMVVALLCADEPSDDVEALSVLGHAVSDALARIVLT